jgi:putative flippase GtrA
MLKMPEIYAEELTGIPPLISSSQEEADTHSLPVHKRFPLLKQLVRFGLVGGLNTLIDLLVLNSLLWLFPTASTPLLVAYNALAYSVGAVNSFVCNKYWTFRQREQATRGELLRFTITALLGMGLNSALLWLVSLVLHPFLGNATVWANASKVFAIAATMLISYLGMRLWVFTSKSQTRFPFFQKGYVSL